MPEGFGPDELIRYHLGELSPAERDKVEARYFADDAFHDQVLAAEEELIDSYVQGELSAEQKEHFEHRFLQVDDRREKVEVARALAAWAPVFAGMPGPKTSAAIPAFINALHDSDGIVRENAADVLGKIGLQA